MSERDYAKMECSRISLCDAYFNARPQIDFTSNRRYYNAGHDAGWNAMKSERDELLSALKSLNYTASENSPNAKIVREAIAKCET